MKLADMHKEMNATERAIILKLIEDILAANCSISVWDGGEWVIRYGKNLEAIFAEMFATDSDTLRVIGSFGPIGSIVLIYGNEEAVISDYTDNAQLESLMINAMALADSL